MSAPWLTVREVGEVMFDQARMTRRGYDEDQVDAFLDRVTETLTGMNAELAATRREIDRLRHWHQDRGASPAALATMSRAENHAEQVIAEAEAKAREILDEANTESAAVRADAARQAEEILTAIRGLADGPVDHRYAAMAAVLVGTRDHLAELREWLATELTRLNSMLTPHS